MCVRVCVCVCVCVLLGNMLIRVEIEDGGRKAKVESCGLGNQVAWET